MHLGRGVPEDVAGPLLVVLRVRKDLLEQMRERAMPEVVQQRSGQTIGLRLFVEALLRWKLIAARVDPILKRLHHVGGPNRVCESRVLCAWKYQRGEPELADPAKALDLTCIEKRPNDPLRHAFEGDQTVDRVPEDHRGTLPPCP